ncbi:MAG: hypothetical protein KJO31_19215 [Gammaproteobacteria bacterium]|nr:hypothetical protein [Gammaproteobacteria bacterium]
MFKVVRISILLFVLFVVSVSTWLTQSRSTDWNNSLWVKVYPINGDGSPDSDKYIQQLSLEDFKPIEAFIARETTRYGHGLSQPVRMELGQPIGEQPPDFGDAPNVLQVMWWSMKLRLWASSVTDDQDNPDPDVRIFVRYHSPSTDFVLENSVGMQKGMVGIVNAFAGRRHRGTNNVVIAHEFLHTLGATDKYDPANGMPHFPAGYGEPDQKPRHPQKLAEIMGGRIAISDDDAIVPKSLKYVLIGESTAREIQLR